MMFCSFQTSLPSNVLCFLVRHLAQYFPLHRVVFVFTKLIKLHVYIYQRLIGETFVGGAMKEDFNSFCMLGFFKIV